MSIREKEEENIYVNQKQIFLGTFQRVQVKIIKQASFALQYNKRMQEMKTVKTRQIPLLEGKNSIKFRKRMQMPFHLQRNQYKELIVYQKKGHWSEKQKLKYAVFLEHFKERFEIKAKRRFNNIFDLMAIFIKTRNPYQCRSHHQKMQKQKFKVDSILAATASKYHPRVYQQLKQRYINEIEALQIDEESNFEKFRERIQKIEMKKSIQRQIMIRNKRVLRSSQRKEMNRNQKSKRVTETKNRQQIKKNDTLNLHRQINKVKEEKMPEIWINKMAQKVPELQKIPNTHNNHLSQQKRPDQNQMAPQKSLQGVEGNKIKQQQIYETLQKMQVRKNYHLDSAYFHYSQYMKHINEANKIQFQLMRQSSFNPMEGGFLRNSYDHQNV